MTAIILRRRKLGRGSSKGICGASTTGIKTVRNWLSRDWSSLEGVSTVFRWGCTSSLNGLIALNAEVVNTAKSINWCADKKRGRLDMQAAGVKVPYTIDHKELDGASILELGREMASKEWVSRPVTHSQGRNLFVGNLVDAVYWLQTRHGDGYHSLKINKVAEYRVFVCQNRAVWVANKTPGNPDDVAWNVTQGGRFDNVRWGQWPMSVVAEAIKAAKVSGTDFCGVDVMVDAEDNTYVLEVNSAPQVTSPYRQQCVAKAFDYIVLNGKEHFPDVENAVQWRDVIHPALMVDGD